MTGLTLITLIGDVLRHGYRHIEDVVQSPSRDFALQSCRGQQEDPTSVREAGAVKVQRTQT